MVDLEAVELNFDGITYAKGASALRQLVAFVGQDAFLAGARRYFSEHAWGNTTLADLLRALTEASDRDLSQWSAQWLEAAGVNTLTPELEVDGSGRITSAAVLQSAPPGAPHAPGSSTRDRALQHRHGRFAARSSTSRPIFGTAYAAPRARPDNLGPTCC